MLYNPAVPIGSSFSYPPGVTVFTGDSPTEVVTGSRADGRTFVVGGQVGGHYVVLETYAGAPPTVSGTGTCGDGTTPVHVATGTEGDNDYIYFNVSSRRINQRS